MIQTWMSLAYATFLIKIFNIEKLQSLLQKRKAKCNKTLSRQEAESIFLNIEKSKRFFFTRTACLEQSLAFFLLATSQGKLIDIVIGVKLAPFASHAWVEIGGIPVLEEEKIAAYNRILVI